ncbi:MAG: radical SAM protein [Candidatus Woesearchaeota archaeon]
MVELPELMEQANKVYLTNFPNTTNFERAVFFSWGCKLKDCKFCYMSIQPINEANTEDSINSDKIKRRTTESLMAETLIIKKLGWDFGFLSGGMGAYTTDCFLDLVKKIYIVLGEKIWINVGPLKKDELIQLQPYIKGVVGSIETVNKNVHDFVCPSKPVEPYLEMFEYATEFRLKKAITIILGLGETEDDFPELKDLIQKYSIEKIHFYGLNPHKGTVFEVFKAPSRHYQAWWISKTRIAFPKIDIQMGIWEDREYRVAYLLNAGANSISKYPALKLFGTANALELEEQCKIANRKLISTLTKLPDIDWNKEVDGLDLDKELKEKIKTKLHLYLNKIMTNVKTGGKIETKL